MGSNVLVVAGHPDDEIFGCGNNFSKHNQKVDRFNLEYEFSVTLEAIKEYKEKIRELSYPCSLWNEEISALYRRAQVRIKTAEAFLFIRVIDK